MPLDRLARVAGHHDELADAGLAGGVDSPVDQGLPGDLEERFARRAAGQPTPPPGGDDDAGRRGGHSTRFLARTTRVSPPATADRRSPARNGRLALQTAPSSI